MIWCWSASPISFTVTAAVLGQWHDCPGTTIRFLSAKQPRNVWVNNHVNPVETHNTTTMKQSPAQSCSYLMGYTPWWRHQMETFSALLAICVGNSPVPGEFPHKGQWRGALIFSLISVWMNGWVNNREAGDLRRYCAHYDVTVMSTCIRSNLMSWGSYLNYHWWRKLQIQDPGE